MDNIAIVHHTLDLGGGEKLVYELCKFYKNNGIQPTVFIPNNTKKEYYDDLLKRLNINVVRFKIIGIRDVLRLKFNYNDLRWKFKTNLQMEKIFKEIIFVNIASASAYYKYFRHRKKVFWHVGNQIQYRNQTHPFDPTILKNSEYKIIFVNKYQITEVESEFGQVEAKYDIIKLFINE